MRTLVSSGLALVIFAATSLAKSPNAPQGKATLTVHEWGTFLSVQGSNGETE